MFDKYAIGREVAAIDFKSLRYVLAVAEIGSISGAAKELGISQPSLSKYLQNLGESLGVRLFERTDGKLMPTYAGERYISAARNILKVAEELDDVSPRQERFFRVACPPFEGSYIHPFAILQFCEKCPDSRLMIIESNEISSLLYSGQANLAITNYKVKGDGLTSELLTHDEVLLVTSASHSIGNSAVWKQGCKRPWVDINLLRNETFIQLFPDQRTRVLSDELLAKENIIPKVMLQTRSTLTAIRVAATGAGVCFAPETGMRSFKFPETPSLFSVGAPIIMDVYFTYNKNRWESELTNKFICFVRAFL